MKKELIIKRLRIFSLIISGVLSYMLWHLIFNYSNFMQVPKGYYGVIIVLLSQLIFMTIMIRYVIDKVLEKYSKGYLARKLFLGLFIGITIAVISTLSYVVTIGVITGMLIYYIFSFVNNIIHE
jgi:hypothetical protein